MVDSLDTMLIMGLHDEFDRSIPVLANMTFALDEVRSQVRLVVPTVVNSYAPVPIGQVRTIL